MDESLTTLSTALFAGAVGLVGYLVTQQWNRRSRKTQIFAEALKAMHEFQGQPYLAYLREADSPEVRRRLAESSNATSAAVRYYLSLLDIESPLAGKAYRALLIHSRDRVRMFGDWASNQPVIPGEVTPSRSPFYYDYDPEVELCIRCMRAEIRVFKRRRRLQGELAAQRARRAAEPRPTVQLIEQQLARIAAERAEYQA